MATSTAPPTQQGPTNPPPASVIQTLQDPNYLTPGGGGAAPTSALPAGTVPSLTERIGDVLYLLGINGTNTNAIANLLAQSNFEYPSGPVHNNLFGTTLKLPGSTDSPTGQASVQQYATWQDGVYAAAIMFTQTNDRPAYNALAQNVDINGYAAALAQSSWEGNNPGAAAANASYGQAVLARYNSILSQIKTDITGYQGAPGNPTDSSGGAANAESDGLPTTAGILGFFGIKNLNWSLVGTVALGIALILVGLIFILHKDVGGAAKALALA